MHKFSLPVSRRYLVRALSMSLRRALQAFQMSSRTLTSTRHPSSPAPSARSALERAEGDRRFHLLFERIPDPMLLLDVESGVFTDWNPAAMRLLNFPATEAVIALRPADISPA